MADRKIVIIGLLGSVLDSGFHEERWKKWRPTVSLCQHSDLPISRLESLNFKIECRQINFSSGYPFCAEGVERFLEFGEGTRQG